MKLRTKLTVFSILLIAIAVAVSCVLILSFVKNDAMEDVSETGLADYLSFYKSFRQASAIELPDKAIVKRSFLVGAFRSVGGFQV